MPSYSFPRVRTESRTADQTAVQQPGGRGNAADAQGLVEEPEQTGLLDLAETTAPAAWARVASGGELLRKGATGEAVSHLQRLLAAAGHDVTVDGIFGRGTQEAVRAYQQGAGLEADGIVGRGTAAVLDGGSAPSRSEERARDVADARDAANGRGEERQGDRGQSGAEGLDIKVQPGSFERIGLRKEVMEVALTVFENAWKAGETDKTIYTVIDFSMSSTDKRMFIFDVQSGELLFNELVTHGSKSGFDTPDKFSNKVGSNMSSIGLAKTAETYQSAKFGGTALRMDGLEDGYNDNMRERAVVMHQADYATPEAIRANGGSRLGRSQGCPAMDPRVAGEVIDTIKNGALVFSYYPDPSYLEDSRYVNG